MTDQADNYDRDRFDVSDEIREKHVVAIAEYVREGTYGHLIDGEWVESDSGETVSAIDATTGLEMARFQRGTPADVDRAVTAAGEALEGTWGQLSADQRADRLDEIADRLAERKAEIAKLDSLEVGKPNKHALFADAEILVNQFRHFASLARTDDGGRVLDEGAEKHAYTRYEPYGVVGSISAWNFPGMFVAWKLGPPLATGNTVVFKPANRAAISTLEVVRTVDAVLPPGAVNVVTGDGSTVGSAITSHPDVRKVSLTGSTRAGREVMRDAADHITAVSLELGGKNPNIVFDDADLEKAVEGTVVSVLFNQGQQCTAGSRLFVHEAVAEDFLAALVERMAELEIGDPLSPLTDIGPMIDHAHQASVREYLETALEEGATIHYEGETPGEELDGAPFVAPTVLTDVDDEDTVAQEEVFGPVVSVHAFAETAEAVRRANDTEYGLAAGVWTEDLERAHTVAANLEAGSVWVNNYLDLIDPAPHGGFKQSGIGRELAKEALDAYRQVKTVKMTFGEIPKF